MLLTPKLLKVWYSNLQYPICRHQLNIVQISCNLHHQIPCAIMTKYDRYTMTICNTDIQWNWLNLRYIFHNLPVKWVWNSLVTGLSTVWAEYMQSHFHVVIIENQVKYSKPWFEWVYDNPITYNTLIINNGLKSKFMMRL